MPYFYRMHEIATPHDGHVEQHMRSSEILTDIVIGMSDGLTVPFALAAGLSGAVGNNHLNLIWIAGLAEIAAGSIAMGLGGYLAGKTEMDHYNSELRREYEEEELEAFRAEWAALEEEKSSRESSRLGHPTTPYAASRDRQQR